MNQTKLNNSPKRTGISRFIGDRAFYKKVLLIAVPIMLQNGITNFVNMLDNIMVGQVGTEQMSGVAIANQLIMVFNMAVFADLQYDAGNHPAYRHALYPDSEAVGSALSALPVFQWS